MILCPFQQYVSLSGHRMVIMKGQLKYLTAGMISANGNRAWTAMPVG